MDLVASQAAAVHSRFMPSQHGRVHYREAGRGQAIVLLHINRQSSALYQELIEALGSRFHVLAPDYPGYGRSDPFGREPSIEDYARCVHALLESRGIRRAVLLGEAVGSAVAVAFAALYPEATAAIVLINCPLTADRAAASAVVGSARARAAGSGDAAADDEAFIARHGQHAPLAPSASWVARVREAHRQCGERCWQAAEALLAFDLRGALGRVTAPALLLTGEFSPFAGFMPEIARLLPQAGSHVIEQSRFGIGWEKAREVARLTSEFVARQTPVPRQG